LVSKNRILAELRVYLDLHGQKYRSIGVSLTRTGATAPGEFEVYLNKHHDVLRGRDSLHASGLRIGRADLIRRAEREWHRRIAEIVQRPERLTGVVFGSAQRVPGHVDFDAIGSIPVASETRRAATIPLPQ